MVSENNTNMVKLQIVKVLILVLVEDGLRDITFDWVDNDMAKS